VGGKAGIILVIGLSAILGYISMNVNNVATMAISNMSMEPGGKSTPWHFT